MVFTCACAAAPRGEEYDWRDVDFAWILVAWAVSKLLDQTCAPLAAAGGAWGGTRARRAFAEDALAASVVLAVTVLSVVFIVLFVVALIQYGRGRTSPFPGL